MPKPSKSSATSATRKKHARKATENDGEHDPQSSVKSKPSKKQVKKGLAPPPKKSYIPPSKLKPTTQETDPLNEIELLLPPELVIILRRISKKDVVTKLRALEELEKWIQEAQSEQGDENLKRLSVVNMLPVWLFRYPTLTVHSSRRIRQATATLQALLTETPQTRKSIIDFVEYQGSESDIARVLGCWCLSRWDVDKSVATRAQRSWARTICLEPSLQNSNEDADKLPGVVLGIARLVNDVLPFLITGVMDPTATYQALHLSPVNIASSNTQRNLNLPAAFKSTVVESVARTEEESESPEDRNARFRISALNALSWILSSNQPSFPLINTLLPLYSSPAFWTILYPTEDVPYLFKHSDESDSFHFGAGQPAVRCAGWEVVNSLFTEPAPSRFLEWINEPNIQHAISNEDSVLKMISCAVLRSAFVETDPLVKAAMWRPLLVYLTKIASAWKLSGDYEYEQTAFLDANPNGETLRRSSREKHDIPTSYVEFQSFLSLGCNGSPVEGYPTILVILSTIPPEMLPFTIDGLSGLFDNMWSAVDGRVLGSLISEKVKATHAFIEAWSECLLWIVGKLIKTSHYKPSPGESEDNVFQQNDTVAYDLVDQQFKRFMSELWSSLCAEAEFTGRLLASALKRLDIISEDLLSKAWSRISSRLQCDVKIVDERILDQMLPFIAALYRCSTASSRTQSNIQNLVIDISIDVMSEWRTTILEDNSVAKENQVNNHGKLLQLFLENFGDILGTSVRFTEASSNLWITWPIAFISQPSLVLVYLRYVNSERRDSVWADVLRNLGSSLLLSFETRVTLLTSFVHSDPKTLCDLCEPNEPVLSILIDQIMDEALTGNEKLLDLMVTLLRYPKPFITENTVCEIILNTVIALDYQLRPMIEGSAPSIEISISSLKLLLALKDVFPMCDLPATIVENTLPHLFIVGFVLPEDSDFFEQEAIVDLSKRLWKAWQTRADENTRNIVLQNIKKSLKILITDIHSKSRPMDVLDSISFLAPEGEVSPVDILPTRDEFSSLLISVPSDPIDESLAVLNFLAFCSETPTKPSDNYDSFGFSPYGRAVRALIHTILWNRHFARANIWVLQHVLVLEHFATEALQVPHVSHPVFSNGRIASADLKGVVEASQRVAVYIFASAGELSSWHAEVVNALSGTTTPKQLDSIGQFVVSVIKQSRKYDTFRDSSVLYTVLRHILPNTDVNATDKWIDLARQLELQAPRTSLVICRAVSEFAPGCSKLDRYRNEIASKLSGILPAQANTHGPRLLHSLAAVAPHLDSDVIFLPHQRAIYVIQTLQRWFSSDDDDMDEAVERDVTLIVYYLAPVLQTVQGAHWEFVLDFVESNLENCSFKDRKSVVLLARSLQLTDVIINITKSSKYLRGLWKERSKRIFTLIRGLLETPTEFPQDLPTSMCKEYALTIAQELPSSLMDENTLSKMCHLMRDSAIENQKLAYFLLRQAAVKRTEHLVVEAAVETQENDPTVLAIPLELFELMQTDVGLVGSDIETAETLRFLLSWMLCFDLFTSASVKVKSAYVDHIRKLDLIRLHLLPSIFRILNVGYLNRTFKLDPWIVDEYWLHMYDAEALYGLQLLAAHVYYRSLLIVPSMIRAFWEGLKDRQLSSAIASYTSTYFSPILVASEFSHVKPSTPVAESLVDDTFKIKVAQATNEVVASFLVDEQQMEVGIKLPTDYPLHTVEVRAIRKVGVNEKTWRRWLFAIQQVMTTHNGRIVDGLALFKKTVSLHFEGQAECAICYSILHVVERSLPTKPCRTCKNRFHTSCLYKWFNTSHSSSCPLCRSDIM